MATLSPARLFRQLLYDQPPGWQHPTTLHAGSCDAICYHFGSTFGARWDRSVNARVRRIPGTVPALAGPRPTLRLCPGAGSWPSSRRRLAVPPRDWFVTEIEPAPSHTLASQSQSGSRLALDGFATEEGTLSRSLLLVVERRLRANCRPTCGRDWERVEPRKFLPTGSMRDCRDRLWEEGIVWKSVCQCLVAVVQTRVAPGADGSRNMPCCVRAEKNHRVSPLVGSLDATEPKKYPASHASMSVKHFCNAGSQLI